MRIAVAASIVFSLATAHAVPPTPFRALLDEEWEYQLRESPTFATSIGDSRYDDKLPDLSFAAIERRKQHARELVPRIEKIDRAKLSADDQLSYDLFLRDAKLAVEGQRFPSELMPLDQMDGVHQLLPRIAQEIPRRNAADFDHFIARIDAYPKVVEQHQALLQKGLERGITPPRVTLVRVGELIGNQIADDPAKSPIYELTFANLPDTIPVAERARLQSAAKQAISAKVFPSLKSFRQFVVDKYIPGARSTVGMSALPDGAAWYTYNIRVATTTDLRPDRIHQIGLDEVARINKEMDSVMRSSGFKGTRPDFFHFLRTDPRFFYTDKEALLTGYRDIAKRIDPELTRLFGKLPRLPYGVRAVPAHAEKTQTTAYYDGGSSETGRPGWFSANTYDLPTRPKWEMEPLTLHEAVPGHHLQVSLSQELTDLPKFRRHIYYDAFGEGWALYAESLGGEIGLLRDPYSKFGALTYEMWRAIRLVVDTGMHAKGWSREKAIAYFKDNAAKTDHDIEVEIDRYLVWPGQALAYKLGQLKIRELRTKVEAKQGPHFDERAFHDLILAGGALPLDVLEARVRAKYQL